MTLSEIRELNLEKRKLFFLLYSLHYIINNLNGSPDPEDLWTYDYPKNRSLAYLHIRIIEAYKKLGKELSIKSMSPGPGTETSPTYQIKLFPDYLLHEKHSVLAEKLKNEFNKEKGKSIRLMFKALEDKNILTIKNRQGKQIYFALKNFFNRDIGTYQSVFDYKYDNIKDKKDFDSINLKIEFLLKSL